MDPPRGGSDAASLVDDVGRPNVGRYRVLANDGQNVVEPGVEFTAEIRWQPIEVTGDDPPVAIREPRAETLGF
jgi:hypothetical protein